MDNTFEENKNQAQRMTTYSEYDSSNTFNDRAAETMQSREFSKQPQKPSEPLNIDEMEIPGAKLNV